MNNLGKILLYKADKVKKQKEREKTMEDNKKQNKINNRSQKRKKSQKYKNDYIENKLFLTHKNIKIYQ